MHDLRHSFASLLINSGRTLYEVQHILGHTQVKTTQRYAHLSQDTFLAAANSATTGFGGSDAAHGATRPFSRHLIFTKGATMTKILLQEFVAEPTCAIGQIRSVAEVPNADLAIFIDGDVKNTDESNVLDFTYFQSAYTYDDYLESYEMLDRLFETCLSLQEKLKQAVETIDRLKQTRHAA
jgi:hypothetical protein